MAQGYHLRPIFFRSAGDKAPALPLWLMDAGVTFNFEDRNAEDLLFGEVGDSCGMET